MEVMKIVQLLVPTMGHRFYKGVGSDLKGQYPEYGRRNDIESKVFIQFTVDKFGGIGDMKVIRGIGGGC